MLKRMGYIVSLITMIWLILPSTIDASEIDTLFSRLEVACINDHHWLDDAFWFDDPAVWTSEASLNAQNSNGSWSDIDYSDTDLTNWTPNNHMLRLRRMAISFRDPNGAYYNN